MTGPSGTLLALWISGLAAAAAAPSTAGERAATRLIERSMSAGALAGMGDAAMPGNRAFPLEAIAAWLSSGFGLPPMQDVPALDFADGRRMAGLRMRDVSPNRLGTTDQAGILAVSDDDARTIYLPEGWTGGTPAEISILVHEMVYHLQNSAGTRFECPEAREKMAYEAQARWLAMFGSDLHADFGIDALTLLVRTSCFR